jgi:hypothetical protein
VEYKNDEKKKKNEDVERRKRLENRSGIGRRRYVRGEGRVSVIKRRNESMSKKD